MDFHFSDRDEALARGAAHLDDIEFVPSKLHTTNWGPAIVVTGVRQGSHACWQCGEFFRLDVPALCPQEVAWGGTYILLHAQCVGRGRLSNSSYRSYADILRAKELKTFEKRATAPLAAAAPADSPIILFPK
jgi:hypothetical protein